jgi:hypothetical protein
MTEEGAERSAPSFFGNLIRALTAMARAARAHRLAIRISPDAGRNSERAGSSGVASAAAFFDNDSRPSHPHTGRSTGVDYPPRRYTGCSGAFPLARFRLLSRCSRPARLISRNPVLSGRENMQKNTFDIEGSPQRRPAPRKRSTLCAKHRRRPAQPAMEARAGALRAARPTAPHRIPGGDAMLARILPRCRGAEAEPSGAAISDAPESPWCWQRPRRRRRGACGRR